MQKCKTASWKTGNSNEQRDYVSLNGQKNILLLDRIFIVGKVLRCQRSINTVTRIEFSNSVSEEVKMLRSRRSSASVCRYILLWFVLVAGSDEHLHLDDARIERSADAGPGSPAPGDAPLQTLELEDMGDAFNTSAGKYTAHFKRRGKN